MSSNQHPIDQEELMAFLDGELPAERAASAAEHLKRCTECQKLAGDLQQVSQALVGWEVEPAPSEIPASISSALDARAAKSASAKSTRWDWRTLTTWPHFKLAVGLAVATVLVIAVAVPSFVKSKMAARGPATAAEIRQNAELEEAARAQDAISPGTVAEQPSTPRRRNKDVMQRSEVTPKKYSPEYGRSAGSVAGLVLDGSKPSGAFGGVADANGNLAKTDRYASDGKLKDLGAPSAPPPPPPPNLAQSLANQRQLAPRGGPMPLNQNTYFNNNATANQSTVEVAAGAAQIEMSESSAPMVIRTAELALTAKDKDFDQAHDRVEAILKLHHGYVGELSLNTPTGAARSLTATLRVPSTQLEATLADLKKLGRVEKESQNGEEVTQQYVDLEARIKNSRNTEQRLVTLQKERTGKLSDVLNVETQISRVRGEIEQMDAQRKSMRNQVDYATVNLTISEDYKAELNVVPVSTGTLIRNAAVDGYRSLVDGLLGLLLWMLSWTPTLLVWFAVLFFPVRYTWRRMKQVFRQRELVA